MWKISKVLRGPDDVGSAGGGTAAPAAAAPVAAPTPAAPAAPASSAPAAPAASPTPAAPAPADGKGNEGYWPADWRTTVSKADEKKLAALGRYASPEAAMDALFAAQQRIRSGELLPALGKNPSAQELTDWRAAHGIPETADKYDLGKLTEGMDPKLVEAVLKEAHGTNQTPDQVKASLKAWNQISQDVAATRAEKDMDLQKTGEDALRAEWGGEFRRNINLIHGLLDGAASPELKDKILNGRLADGTPIGSSPEALKMLVGLALIQNPSGVVVPGGMGENNDGIREELDKLQKVPTAKKTAEQSERQRKLIDAAIQGGNMDASGNWVTTSRRKAA